MGRLAMNHRPRLQSAATQIAAKFNKPPLTPIAALRKLVVAPRWAGYGKRAPGLRRWKSGELVVECVLALMYRDRDALAQEWGDAGYYVAHTWGWLWWLYEAITPANIIEAAVQKFERRAKK